MNGLRCLGLLQRQKQGWALTHRAPRSCSIRAVVSHPVLRYAATSFPSGAAERVLVKIVTCTGVIVTTYHI